MSTTRKIEGWASSLAEIGDDTTYSVITEPPSDGLNGWTPATLIIGGKGYTKEEVKALLKDFAEDKAIWIQDVRRIAAKHGITL